jgi:antitoxin VapB
MLNIKNAETYRLARELADRTGETLTAAVTVALRERLERLATAPRQKRITVAEIMAIGRQAAATMGPGPHLDHADEFYDKDGLPI